MLSNIFSLSLTFWENKLACLALTTILSLIYGKTLVLQAKNRLVLKCATWANTLAYFSGALVAKKESLSFNDDIGNEHYNFFTIVIYTTVL